MNRLSYHAIELIKDELESDARQRHPELFALPINFIERWLIKNINWVKPLDDLSLEELFKLQHDVGMAIAKKMEVKGWEKLMGDEERVHDE